MDFNIFLEYVGGRCHRIQRLFALISWKNVVIVITTSLTGLSMMSCSLFMLGGLTGLTGF